MKVVNDIIWDVKESDLVDGTFNNWSGVKVIGKKAFYGLKKLTYIVVPDTVKGIGYQAFYGCENLKTALLKSGNEHIEHYSFSDCLSLEKVSIPETITYISPYAFCGSYSLKDVNGNEAVFVEGFPFVVMDKTFFQGYKCLYGYDLVKIDKNDKKLLSALVFDGDTFLKRFGDRESAFRFIDQ